MTDEERALRAREGIEQKSSYIDRAGLTTKQTRQLPRSNSTCSICCGFIVGCFRIVVNLLYNKSKQV